MKAIRELIVEKNVANIDTLTTYWARHSWATIAASLDIPKETIAAALGHSNHTVTDIYIEFDYRKGIAKHSMPKRHDSNLYTLEEARMLLTHCFQNHHN